MIEQILAWADAYHAQWRKWPTVKSGPVAGANVSWNGINERLRVGYLGLPGGSSLIELLGRFRGVPRWRRGPLSAERILAWVDAHVATHRVRPCDTSGQIPGTRETWLAIDTALRNGGRGLPSGSSLSRFLAKHRGAEKRQNLPPLSAQSIIEWARAHHAATGRWPNRDSGPIPYSQGRTWESIDEALRNGFRGFLGGSSLAKFLTEQCGMRKRQSRPTLTVKQILEWARAHRRRTGMWPTANSGGVYDAPGETWAGIVIALYYGNRGLPGGQRLFQLLAKRYGVTKARQLRNRYK